MTNHWVDLKNADVVMIIGSNAAENHPMSFKWIQRAIDERDCTLISVDPRFTRTAAKAHHYAPIRSGTDIAFVNGIINYALSNNRFNEEYVRYYTNGAMLIDPDFDFDPTTGLFSSWSGSGYDKSSWGYQTDAQSGTDGAVTTGSGTFTASSGAFTDDMVGRRFGITSGADAGSYTIESVTSGTEIVLTGYSASADDTTVEWSLPGIPIKDMTLEDPQCVINLMKIHYSRYTPQAVYEITGCPPTEFLEVAEAFTSTGEEDRCGTIMYAMGTTQHTHGTQNVRSYAILQLLMGNIGLSGGGINALRGESNVQGSTDMALLYHILPGYLKTPRASNTTLGLDTSQSRDIVFNQDVYNADFQALSDDDKAEAMSSYLWKWAPQTDDLESANWWTHYPKYMVSLLKAFYGDAATSSNDFCYHHLGKVDDATNYSHLSIFHQMGEGTIKGLFCFGQNPAVGGPNAEFERDSLASLDWLVCVDLWETETSIFWKRPGADPASIDTEVWMLPAAGSYEKEGSIVNSGRWAQWRYKACEPPGDARDDAWIISQLVLELQSNPPGQYPEAITDLNWPYLDGDHVDIDMVAREINGQNVADGTQVTNFVSLAADGSTTSGNWLYCGQYTEDDGNKLKNRDNSNSSDVSGIGLYAGWSWCWPINRRIIYNRASLRPDNQEPWDPARAVITVDQDSTSATYKKPNAGDVPDGGWVTDPTMAGYRHPFIMKPEGHSRLFGMGLADGPMTEHYEPMESPLPNSVVNNAIHSPAVFVYPGALGTFADSAEYPVVCSTYRVTEHWQAGMMTRNIPWLGELMPYMFCEISHELAEEQGISSGDTVRVETIRGSVEAAAVVTWRFKPFQLGDKTVHQIGVPWHWGYAGLFTGDSGNSLTPHVGDCNTRIPEYKAFLCKVTKA